MEKYSHIVEAILKDSHEIAAHGYQHENANLEPRERQVYWLDKQIDVIERMTGTKPRGWRSPLYNASKDSPELLAERGIACDASLMGDDVPYILNTRKGDVIALPSHWAMDDWPHYMHSIDFHYTMTIKSPNEAMTVFESEFKTMYKHGGMLVTVWHPFVSGRLARLDRVVGWIDQMMLRGNVWFATMEEIVAHAKRCRDDGSWQSKVEKLPYYERRISEWDPVQGMVAE